MASDELVRLCWKVRSSPLFRRGMAFVSDQDHIKETEALPETLREDVRTLVHAIREAIPNDFGFTVSFEALCLEVATELQDGNTGGGAGRFRFKSRKSMLSRLRRHAWDEARADLMKQFDIFDQLEREADDRPADIPSSEQAVKRLGLPLQEVIEEVRQESLKTPFVLIYARDDIDELGIEDFQERKRMIWTMSDRMTTQCDILAVLELGRAWSFSEIEAAKLEAVEGLTGISRAKAERRFLV